MIANTRHAVGDCYASQTIATIECGAANFSHAVGDRDARQSAAIAECFITDTLDICR